MIGDSVYRFEEVDSNLDDGDQVLVKITYVDINTVTIAQDEDGIIRITEKDAAVPTEETDDDDDDEAPAQQPKLRFEQQLPKYRLEPEGNLFRLNALRNMPGVYEGSRGGLVASEYTLSHEGICWVSENSRVTHPVSRVTGNARIGYDSNIAADSMIGDQANLSGVRAEGRLNMSGFAQLHDTVVTQHDHLLHLEGTTYIVDSTIEPTDDMRIGGCNVHFGHLRNNFEVVSIFSPMWGWFSGYRNNSGMLTYAIGCQRRHHVDELLLLARDYDVDPTYQEMLRAFAAVVEASRSGWYVPPAPPQPVVPESKLVSFADLAQKARAVEF